MISECVRSTWEAANYLSVTGENMLEIVLGALVLIGVFVFWCDVHGFMEQGIEQDRKTLIRALLLPYSKMAPYFAFAGVESIVDPAEKPRFFNNALFPYIS